MIALLYCMIGNLLAATYLHHEHKRVPLGVEDIAASLVIVLAWGLLIPAIPGILWFWYLNKKNA